MKNLTLLTYLKANDMVRTLEISVSGEVLLATGIRSPTRGNCQSLQYYTLEQNDDAYRLNADLKNVSHSYATPDNLYLAIMTDKDLKIWYTKSRTVVSEYELKAKFRYKLRTLNGTSDSKFLFF